MYKRKYHAGDENSAFSQSLKNVQWKFLNERPSPQVETIWAQRASMINEDNNNNYNDNHSRSHYHQNNNQMNSNSRYNDLAPLELPSKSSGMFQKYNGDEYDRKRLEYVKQLESALSQSEFPSQILKYLSYEETNNKNDHRGNNDIINNGSNKINLKNTTLQRREMWENEDDPLNRETIRKHHEEKLVRDEIEARTNIDSMFREDSYGNLVRNKEDTDLKIKDEDNNNYDTTDASFYDDLDESRSPSPIIIWRPAARVKVATDVPPELLEDLLDDEEEEMKTTNKQKRPSNIKRSRRMSSFHASHSPKSSNGKNVTTKFSTFKEKAQSKSPRLKPDQEIIALANGKNKMPMSTLEKIKRRPKYRDFKHKYGAWYIKPDKWNACANGRAEKVLTVKGKSKSETEKMRQEMSTALDETQKKLEKKIPKLFITEQYRKYLLEHNRQTNTQALPLPHYLQQK
jgi:hypothetical protein